MQTRLLLQNTIILSCSCSLSWFSSTFPRCPSPQTAGCPSLVPEVQKVVYSALQFNLPANIVRWLSSLSVTDDGKMYIIIYRYTKVFLKCISSYSLKDQQMFIPCLLTVSYRREQDILVYKSQFEVFYKMVYQRMVRIRPSYNQ